MTRWFAAESGGGQPPLVRHMHRSAETRPFDLHVTLEKSTAPSSSEVFSALAHSVWQFRGRVLAAVVLLVIAKLAAVGVPLVLKGIIDELSRPDAALMLPAFLLLGYALMRFATTFFGEIRDVVFSRVTQSTVAEFTLRVFEHVHRLSASFHVRRSTGVLTREVERGTAGIGFLLGVALFTIVPTIVEIGAVVAIMVSRYSDWFTTVIAATFAGYTVFTLVFTQRRAIHQRAQNELDSTASGRIVDSLLNFETVRYYTNEHLEVRRLRDIMREWINVGVRNQKALSLLHIGQSGIIACGVATVMLLAGEAVVGRTMTVGDLVLINAYVIQVCLPLNSLGFVFREANDALINVEKLFALLAQKPPPGEAAELPVLHVVDGEVRFENVSFSYEPSRQILWNVDFRIEPGKKVAVVGGSGSGKSTLARLLFRFHDPSAGRITIDGCDLRSVSARSLRESIGIVPQDTTLFNDTIAYNIGYGRAGASLADVIDAARAANIHGFIASLPQQYETIVGERGIMLSGGERQRIAIARAILKNPPILIFDEATSALDTHTERAIQQQLDRLASDRSTLVIAHRLSSVVSADLILVLEHGRIVDRGSHQELLARGGLYAQMWSLQQQESALESAERKAAVQPVNLSSIVVGAIDALRDDIEARDIRLYTTIGAEMGRVNGDPSELQQMVFGLLENAVRVTPSRGRMEVRLEPAGPNTRLYVSDSGPPPVAVSAPKFDRGRRAPPALPSASLDVARIRRTVEQHGGTLLLQPADGVGTTYILELPLRTIVTEQQLPRARERGAAAALPSIEGRRIMIVDDQEEARDALTDVLNAHGASVDALSAGVPAVAKLRDTPRDQWPDALVCDIALPDEDGYTVVERVRALEAERNTPLAQRMPAIALSGYAAAEDRMRALLAGFQLHLGKPVDSRELVASIASLIDDGHHGDRGGTQRIH